ncbi:hypothetical protein AR1Y2_3503 [Anaerostipes rhamnosivorans]|uniref:Uncharacterized protein n=1 Tax=Anaerostipes rhamnosivorans TaxID=1229621 RepID=A0A4P8IJ55_9FIRM|nr:hypothetical protein AR1Y2_3503 [Anaerostipes rhamnosivorans]
MTFFHVGINHLGFIGYFPVLSRKLKTEETVTGFLKYSLNYFVKARERDLTGYDETSPYWGPAFFYNDFYLISVHNKPPVCSDGEGVSLYLFYHINRTEKTGTGNPCSGLKCCLISADIL